jgi:dTDP-4-dehydrorhamnose 3,5-epimerase
MLNFDEEHKKPVIMRGGVFTDDRGSVRYVNDFDFSMVQRFYQIANHKKNFIRAWHGHMGEGKYVYVVKGSALIGATKMIETHPNRTAEDRYMCEENPLRIVLSDAKPEVLWIPPGYANGAMTLEEGTIIQYFSTASMEETNGDDIRFCPKWCDIWNIEEC